MRQLSCLLIAILAFFQSRASAAHITFSIPTTPILPNPSTLPPSTQATLFRHNNTLTVPITRYNGFDFKHVTPGSYLLTIQCRDYFFPPLRVDVSSTGISGGDGKQPVSQVEEVEVFQTFWGNEWGNKGEKKGGGLWTKGKGDRVIVEVRPISPKDYYQERGGFNPMQFLKNPMILMALVSLVLIVGLPYLTESMDEETRKEYEDMQQNNPLTGGALKSDAAQAIQNFDLASWMAGKSNTK